jgi:hypothetical protein
MQNTKTMNPLPNQHWTKQIKQVHAALEAWQKLTKLNDSYFITSEGNIFAKTGDSVVIHPDYIEETGLEVYKLRSKRLFYSRKVITPKKEESVLYRLKISHDDIQLLEKFAFSLHQELHSEVLPLTAIEHHLENIVCRSGWQDMERLNILLEEKEELEKLEARQTMEQLLPDDFDVPAWSTVKGYSKTDIDRNKKYLGL